MRILNSIFEQSVTGLNKALDLSWQRGKVLTSNIANAETPRYRATELDFGKELEKAFDVHDAELMVRTHTNHLELERNGSARMRADLTGANKADGNNVDIDQQMVALSNNGGDFANAVQFMKHKFGMYRTSIREGRG